MEKECFMRGVKYDIIGAMATRGLLALGASFSVVCPIVVMLLIGAVAEWSKAAVCKTVLHGFESRRHLHENL